MIATRPLFPHRPHALLALALALSACGVAPAAPGAPTLDEELVDTGRNGHDPLLIAAVQDPIMTDPQLSTRSNADAIRPPSQPYAAAIPATDVVGIAATGDTADGALKTVPAATPGACRRCAVARDAITLGALAARQGNAAMARCAPSLSYAAGWANRLPADLSLHPAAHVVEAAGTESPRCHVRAVSFAIARPVARMLDWYHTRATKAGYTTEHQADATTHVLAGSRRADGGAYVAVLHDDGDGGSEVELLVNTGR